MFLRPNRKLKLFTGAEDLHTKSGKKELGPMFKPVKDMGHVNGNPNYTDKYKKRMLNGRFKSTELPFEQIQVGPGLNKGFTADPSGGFHQENTRDYIMPKTVDELRTKNNPRLQYKKPFTSGKNLNDKRVKQSQVFKHRPDTFYANSKDRYFTTTGRDIRETSRPTVLVKDTNRQTTSAEYYGGAKTDVNSTIDYGKSAMEAPTTERELTGVRTHISNATSMVKALIAPLLDVMRTTRKEFTEGNKHQGNFSTNVSKLQVYDPDDVPQTTKKQLTQDNPNQIGYFGNQLKTVVYDPDDVPQTTKKQLTQDDNRFGPAGTVTMTAPSSQINYDNVNLNEVREGTLKLREPTKCNVSLTNGGDIMNVDIQKLEKDRENQRKFFHNKVYGEIRTLHENTVTKEGKQLPNEPIKNRIHSDMVKAFKNNPYTKSLNTY